MTLDTTNIQAAGAGACVLVISSTNATHMVVGTDASAQVPVALDAVFSASCPHVLVDSVLSAPVAATYSTFTWYVSTVVLRQSATVAIADQGKVERAIASDIQFSPIDQSAENVLKQYSTAQVHFRNEKSCSEMNIAFRNDFTNGTASTNWKSEVFGGATATREYLTSKSKVLRTYVPLDASVGTFVQPTMTHAISCEPWEVQAVSIQVETETDVTTR
jgi:hypothetical protein